MSGRVFRRSSVAEPPVAVSAHGSTIVDAEGREYLDAAGGAVVVRIGHGRREVARAPRRPARDPRVRARLRLHDRAAGALRGAPRPPPPMADPAIYPVSGGSEAIETALKLARANQLARGEKDRDVYRALGELPRQHPRRPRPLGPAAAARPYEAVARPVPARQRGVPVPGHEPGSQAMGDPRRSSRSWSSRSEAAGPGRWPRSSPSRSSGPRSPRSSRPPATGRRSRTSAAGTARCSSSTR